MWLFNYGRQRQNVDNGIPLLDKIDGPGQWLTEVTQGPAPAFAPASTHTPTYTPAPVSLPQLSSAGRKV